MTYVEKLYYLKKLAVDKIMDRENTGFYLIEGYHYKNDDITKLEKLHYMIETWNNSGKFVWNDISKGMELLNLEYKTKKLNFRSFVYESKIESKLINYKKIFE